MRCSWIEWYLRIILRDVIWIGRNCYSYRGWESRIYNRLDNYRRNMEMNWDSYKGVIAILNRQYKHLE